MKTRVNLALLISAFLLGTSFSVHAQEMSRQVYLQKSKNQKTAAFILLGAGALMVGRGICLYNEKDGYGDVLILYTASQEVFHFL